MTTFELQEGEDLLRRCEHVVLKKLNGHLLLTNKRLIWTPPDGEKYLSIPLGVIKKHAASKADSPHCLLRLYTEINGKDQQVTFLFGGENAVEDRNSLRELLTEALRFNAQNTPDLQSTGGVKKREHEDTLDAPTSKRPKTGPIKKEKEQYPSGVKRLLLEQDPELKQVYDQVVTTGIITDEEFWSTRQEMIREAEKRGRKDLQQKQGLPSQLQSMIQPISKEGETVRYRLTNAMIHQIFVEYPLVERAYKEFVPHKMTAKEFWTKFLKSQRQNLREKERAEKAVSATSQVDSTSPENSLDAMFSRLTLTPEQEREEMRKQIEAMDPTVNLAKEDEERGIDDDEDEEASEILKKEKQKRLKSQQLIKKFNRHGHLLLNSIASADTERGAEVEKPDRLRVVIEETALRDLEETEDANTNTEPTHTRANIFRMIIAPETSMDIDVHNADVRSLITALKEWTPSSSVIEDVAESQSHSAIMSELFEEEDDHATMDDEESIANELKGQLNVVEELLRHFWVYMTLPATLDNEEKLQRIMDSLYAHSANLEQLRNNFTGHIGALLDAALDPIAQAKTVFRNRLRPV